jgi:hypothetical protein
MCRRPRLRRDAESLARVSSVRFPRSVTRLHIDCRVTSLPHILLFVSRSIDAFGVLIVGIIVVTEAGKDAIVAAVAVVAVAGLAIARSCLCGRRHTDQASLYAASATSVVSSLTSAPRKRTAHPVYRPPTPTPRATSDHIART